MKFFFVLMFSCLFLIKLPAQTVPGHQVAARIANCLKDSLFLSSLQRDSIYDINIRLQDQKTQVRSQYSAMDSLQYYIQRVENSRDSLYKRIITDDDKYGLYKQRKRFLLMGN